MRAWHVPPVPFHVDKSRTSMVRVVTWKVHHHWLHGVAIELGILGQDLFVDITQVLHNSLIPCSLSVPSSSSA
jgi:hypothetical protein